MYIVCIHYVMCTKVLYIIMVMYDYSTAVPSHLRKYKNNNNAVSVNTTARTRHKHVRLRCIIKRGKLQEIHADYQTAARGIENSNVIHFWNFWRSKHRMPMTIMLSISHLIDLICHWLYWYTIPYCIIFMFSYGQRRVSTTLHKWNANIFYLATCKIAREQQHGPGFVDYHCVERGTEFLSRWNQLLFLHVNIT
jgi:hypothetical protein